jgi:hypothetical protein
MWKLNKLANKAAEAIQNAKKGIEDIAKETPNRKEGNNEEILKNQCSKYREQVVKLKELNQNLEKEVESFKERQGFVDFKVFIGRIEPDDIVFESQAAKFKEIGEELQRKLDEKTFEFDEVLKELEKNRTRNAETDENLKNSRIKEEEVTEKVKVLNENLSRVLEKNARVEKEIFFSLKTSFESIGLSMAGVKAEELGLEDIQEFVFTQTRYIEDCFKEMKNVCSQIGQNPENLNDFRTIFKDFLLNSQKTVKACEENVKNLIVENEKISKEKDEVSKLNKKLSERVKILFEEVKKATENAKVLEKLKEDKAQNEKMFEEQKKKLEQVFNENLLLKEKIKEFENNFKHLEARNIKNEESSENLKKRVKTLSSELFSKEKLLKDEENKTKTLLNDLENFKKLSETEITKIKTENLQNAKTYEESSLQKIEEISKKLKETQNELKDLRVENIQLINKIKKFEEIEKNYELLCSQNKKNLEKIEDLLKENEKNCEKLKKIQEKHRALKNNTELLNKTLENSHLEHERSLKKLEEQEILKNSLILQNDMLSNKLKFNKELVSGMVDKRMISTFLLNFLNEKNSSNSKKQMLRAMSEVLEMSPDQKEKLCLQVDPSFISQVKGYLTRTH